MSTNRGETWAEISPDLTTNDPSKLTVGGRGGDGNIQYCTITTFDESTLIPGLLWAGTDDGNVWLTRDNGKAWTKLNDKIPGNPGYWVSRVAASPSDPATAYVSYTGLRNDDFRPFVYKTTDFGATWTSLSAGLAEGPVNVVREDVKNPNLLFAGTDFGVYVSIDGGKAWMKLKNDLPTQPVHDLKIHPLLDLNILRGESEMSPFLGNTVLLPYTPSPAGTTPGVIEPHPLSPSVDLSLGVMLFPSGIAQNEHLRLGPGSRFAWPGRRIEYDRGKRV